MIMIYYIYGAPKIPYRGYINMLLGQALRLFKIKSD